MKHSLHIAVLTLCIAGTNALPAQADDEVYKSVDESGRVVFSDKPDKNSEVVDTTIQNLHEGVSPENVPENSKSEDTDEKKQATSYSVRLISPQPGYRLGPAEKSLHIAISTNPKLTSSHKVQFYVDGKAVGPASRALSTRVPMGMTMRGQRSVSARIVDEKGLTVGGSNSVTINVIRPY